MSVLIPCGVHKALHKMEQKTGTELPYSLEYAMSGPLLTRNVLYLFCPFVFRSVVYSACRKLELSVALDSLLISSPIFDEYNPLIMHGTIKNC